LGPSTSSSGTRIPLWRYRAAPCGFQTRAPNAAKAERKPGCWWVAPVGDHAFVNVEVAARALEGGCESQRLELTAGYHAGRNWLALGQIFFDAPQDGQESIKAELTLVHLGRRGRGRQIEIRARLDGEDAEPALVIGLWRGPRD
jgi:hypothetical protein